LRKPLAKAVVAVDAAVVMVVAVVLEAKAGLMTDLLLGNRVLSVKKKVAVTVQEEVLRAVVAVLKEERNINFSI
jgi:hypothetical protein